MGIFLTPHGEIRDKLILFLPGPSAMHILLWFRLAAGEGAMNFSLSQKWSQPPLQFVLISCLSIAYFFSNPLCLLSHLPRSVCVSPVFVPPFLSLNFISAASPLHNGSSLTLTSPSRLVSTPMCLNASRELLPETHSCGYLDLRSQHCCWDQSTHCDCLKRLVWD